MGKAAYSVLFLLMMSLSSVFAAADQKPAADYAECYDNSIQVPCPFPADYFEGLDFAKLRCADYSYTKLGHEGAELDDHEVHVDYGGSWIMTRDNLTGLIWEIKTSKNKKDLHNYNDAVMYAKNMELGGYADWRVPAAGELFSLVNQCRFTPAIDDEWFPNTLSESYWSSTADRAESEGMWRIRFGSGIVLFTYNRSAVYHVRAVRSDNP